MPETELRYDPDTPVPLHSLVYFGDGDDVTIGRRDTDSYGIFPPDGAQVVRHLEAGETPRQVGRWYENEFGESADIDHVLAALEELELIRGEHESPAGSAPVRWQRLAKVLFSKPAWILYGLLVGWAVAVLVQSPELRPNYRHLLFADYYTVIEVGLFIGAVPLLLLHECFHALAGRRLGIGSRLRISRRFYYVVLETALDGLVAVPRGKRYLPILAGTLSDVLAFAALIIVADLSRAPGGGFSLASRLCLAFAFATVLRVIWQFFFYLRTDLYALITTVLGCVDLHTTAKRMLVNRVKRLFGRRAKISDEVDWHPVDRRVARWYSWLIVVGYTISIATLVLAVSPVIFQMFGGAFRRLSGTATPWGELLDSAVFIGFNLFQIVLTVWLTVRERRQRKSQFQHVIA